jgi:hypothetical protein
MVRLSGQKSDAAAKRSREETGMRIQAPLLAAVCVIALSPMAVRAASAPRPYAGALTAQGVPNLEGVWSNLTMSRFERSPQFGDRLVMTEKEVAEAEHKAADLAELGRMPTDPKATVKDLPNDCGNGRDWCNVNAAYTDVESSIMRVHGEPRTSLITFPANGRVPWRPGKAPGARIATQPTPELLFGAPAGAADNPEDRSLPERCIVSQNFRNGALITPTLYNNNMQIVQSKDTVAIMVEMSHEARLVRMGGTHRTDGIKPWFGDSIGRYEGPTLVVETTGFNPKQLTRESEKLKLTERFTRVAKDRILYQFRVEDPDTYTQPWGGEYEFSPTGGLIYEYACHEGNHGMENLLRSARYVEQEEKKTAAQNASNR